MDTFIQLKPIVSINHKDVNANELFVAILMYVSGLTF
jgi:hypothetical protein